MPSRSRRNSQEGPSTTPAVANGRGSGGRGNAARAASLQADGGGQVRGLWGWFQDAGAWVGEQASGAAQAATDAAHAVAQTTGDLWDVATSSEVDVDWGARRVTLQTDLDEVMDLMPASVREALQLDRTAAENTVRAVYDHRAGTVTLTADVLELSGVQTESLSAGSVSLEGVRLVLANPGGGLPFVGENTGLPVWKDADDNLVADLFVAGLVAEDVVAAGSSGPVQVSRLVLSDLQGKAEDAEGAPGGAGSVAGFSVASALLEGVTAQGTSVERLEAKQLSAGVSDPGESAFLEAGSLRASGAARGDIALGGASVLGARVDIDNAGGGMPLLDATPDTNLTASVTSQAASINDFQSGGTRVQSAAASGLSGTVSGQSASVSAQSLRGAGLETASVSTTAANANGVKGDLRWGEGLHAGLQADGASARGVRTADGAVARMSAQGLAADVTPGAAGLSAERLDVSKLGVGGASLDSGTAYDASVRMAGGERRVAVGSANARGAAHAGGLTAQSLDLADLDVRTSGGATHMGAAMLRADGVNKSGGVSPSAAGSLVATDTQAVLGPDSVSARVGGLSGTDLSHGDFAAGSAQLAGVGVSQSGGATALDAEGFALGDLATPWMDARSLSGEQGSVALRGEDLDAALDRVRMEGGTIADRVGIEAAALTGLTASRQAGRGRIGVETGTLSQVRDQTTGAALASAQITGASLEQTTAGTQVGLSSVDAQGLATAQGGAGTLSARGARAQIGTEASTAGIDSLAVRDAHLGDSLSVGSADLTGLVASSAVGGSQASVSQAELSDVRAATATGTTQVGALSAQDASLRQDAAAGTLSGGVGSLDARGVAGRYTAGNGQGNGSAADRAALVRSGTALVDDGQLRGSALLRASDTGTFDVAPDTRVDASLGLRDGRVDPATTRVSASNPLGGPLWTTVNGAYVTPDGKAKASVSGWADKDITGMVNEATGVEGKRRLGTISEMGAGMASSMGDRADGRSSGGGMIEPGTARAAGWVSLKEGTVDAGSLGSATLARPAQTGDNLLNVEYGEKGLGVAADRLALDGATTEAGSVGATTVDDVSVTADGSGGSTVQASRLRAEDLRFGQ